MESIKYPVATTSEVEGNSQIGSSSHDRRSERADGKNQDGNTFSSIWEKTAQGRVSALSVSSEKLNKIQNAIADVMRRLMGSGSTQFEFKMAAPSRHSSSQNSEIPVADINHAARELVRGVKEVVEHQPKAKTPIRDKPSTEDESPSVDLRDDEVSHDDASIRDSDRPKEDSEDLPLDEEKEEETTRKPQALPVFIRDFKVGDNFLTVDIQKLANTIQSSGIDAALQGATMATATLQAQNAPTQAPMEVLSTASANGLAVLAANPATPQSPNKAGMSAQALYEMRKTQTVAAEIAVKLQNKPVASPAPVATTPVAVSATPVATTPTSSKPVLAPQPTSQQATTPETPLTALTKEATPKPAIQATTVSKAPVVANADVAETPKPISSGNAETVEKSENPELKTNDRSLAKAAAPRAQANAAPTSQVAKTAATVTPVAGDEAKSTSVSTDDSTSSETNPKSANSLEGNRTAQTAERALKLATAPSIGKGGEAAAKAATQVDPKSDSGEGSRILENSNKSLEGKGGQQEAAAASVRSTARGPATTTSRIVGLNGATATPTGLNGQSPVNLTNGQGQSQSSTDQNPSESKSGLDSKSQLTPKISSAKGGSEANQNFSVEGEKKAADTKAQAAEKASATKYTARSASETKEVYTALSRGIERMQAARQTSMTLRVSFDQGGSLEMKISMNKGQVQAQIQTDVAGLESALKANWSELANEWQQKGTKLAPPQFAQSQSDAQKENENPFDSENRKQKFAEAQAEGNSSSRYFQSNGRRGQQDAQAQEDVSEGNEESNTGGGELKAYA